MPKVSILLPFYNAEKTLLRAAESVLNQSFEDFELLLVDNDSTDGSGYVAREILQKDKRTKLLFEGRRGVVFATQKGFDNASGEFIARTDADDVWHRDKLAVQYEFMRNNADIDVVSCRVVYAGNREGMRIYVEETNKYLTENDISLSRFSELQIINPTILFKRAVAEKYGLYKDGNFPEDYEMFLRWSEKGVKFAKVPEYLFFWYDYADRLTRTDARYSVDAFYKVKAGYLFRFLKENNRFFPDIVVWGAGRLSRKRADFLKKEGLNILFYIDVDKNKIDGKRVISYTDIPSPGKYFTVSFVNNRGMRHKIREYFLSREYVEGKDFILA